MKTPGVYIVEKNAFPNSVVEVATAIPAFIGVTQKAENGGKTLSGKPWRISSMSEFHNYFGGAPDPIFSIAEIAAPEAPADPPVEGEAVAAPIEADFTAGGKEYTFKQESGNYLLYYSMLMFFANGGGACYIVSVGKYGDTLNADMLTKGIATLIKEQEPTLVLTPEAVLLKPEDCIAVQQAALMHCGDKMKNRFAILDVHNGFKDRQDPDGDVIDKFRGALGINHLDFGAAYYPWLNTSIIQDRDLSYQSISNKDQLQSLLKTEQNIPEELPADASPKMKNLNDAISSITKDDLPEADKSILNKTLVTISPLFNTILKEIKNKLNLMPPAAAMAGIYTMVDNSRGVWKAPANVSVNSVVSPAVNITHDDQEDLNVTLQGKSINAIRTFVGEGTLVWGARTLDGNSQDWRYINVRRTMIMLEESIKIASKAYVFEPNTSNTWVSIKTMISNFLNGIWKRGGLAGSSPGEAFVVQVGLGETMTPNDILDGVMRITVLVALVHPAEFIEITFQQKMQES